jgi:predicted ATP-dependent endonuclease of OLD family
MAINRVEIKYFLEFKSGFAVDFCPGVNVFIGENGTGKTTLLRILYRHFANTRPLNDYDKDNVLSIFDSGEINVWSDFTETEGVATTLLGNAKLFEGIESVFIPEKDFLSHAKGLPETARYGKAELTNFEIDVIEKARVLASAPEQPMYRKICDLIGGEPEHDGQSFFMKRYDIAKKIPFSMEASGYRKFGLLAMLVRNEMIKTGTLLFWDEPENSLNPELIPVLVDILLELSRNGVQIFIATHDYNLTRYFDVRKDKSVPVVFHELSKKDGQIVCNSSPDYIKLPNNFLEKASADLFDAVVDAAMEAQDNE